MLTCYLTRLTWFGALKFLPALAPIRDGVDVITGVLAVLLGGVEHQAIRTEGAGGQAWGGKVRQGYMDILLGIIRHSHLNWESFKGLEVLSNKQKNIII